MLNILHTIETRGPGGAEVLVFDIAKYLAAGNCCNFGYFIKKGWLQDRFKAEGYETTYHPLKTGLDIRLLYDLIGTIKKRRIDVIHAHEFTMSFYSCIAASFTGANVICTFHGMNYHSDNFRRQLMMKFIANTSSCVTVSEKVKNHICNHAKINAHKIVVIENGIKIPTEFSMGSLKKELRLPSDCILAGSVGRLHEIKGHQYFVNAAAELVKKYRNIYFTIAGDGAERESLFSKINESGLSDRFFLLGTRTDIQNILSSIDIFVLPSLSEGTSLALLEAMSYGLPIVATNVGNNGKLVKNEKNGFLIAPQSPGEISRSISRIIENAMFEIFRIENKQLVRESYSLDKMMQNYLELFPETDAVPD
jgi:glycosyltransferase involved in cell wall biosynthesis